MGGLKVDFGSVLACLGLICARCAAGLAAAFGLLRGCGYASFGALLASLGRELPTGFDLVAVQGLLGAGLG